MRLKDAGVGPKVTLLYQEASWRLQIGRHSMDVQSRVGLTIDVDGAHLRTCCIELDFKSMRKRQTTINPDGSATTHLSIQCTLDDISQVISFRPEDIAFALNECGLLQHRQDEMTGRSEAFVILSREMVEQAAKRWKPRKSIILPQHLKLDFLPGKTSG
jgi:hypothetical protein